MFLLTLETVATTSQLQCIYKFLATLSFVLQNFYHIKNIKSDSDEATDPANQDNNIFPLLLLPSFPFSNHTPVAQCRKRFSHINPLMLQREGQTDLNQEQSETQLLVKQPISSLFLAKLAAKKQSGIQNDEFLGNSYIR